tara:strand:- start:28342 stop:28500 length:159 start_codon:yes stop_codon:yes gene_type:complete
LRYAAIGALEHDLAKGVPVYRDGNARDDFSGLATVVYGYFNYGFANVAKSCR